MRFRLPVSDSSNDSFSSTKDKNISSRDKCKGRSRFSNWVKCRLPLIKCNSTVHRFQPLFQISSERRFCLCTFASKRDRVKRTWIVKKTKQKKKNRERNLRKPRMFFFYTLIRNIVTRHLTAHPLQRDQPVLSLSLSLSLFLSLSLSPPRKFPRDPRIHNLPLFPSLSSYLSIYLSICLSVCPSLATWHAH